MRPSARTLIIGCDIACQVYGMCDPQLEPSLVLLTYSVRRVSHMGPSAKTPLAVLTTHYVRYVCPVRPSARTPTDYADSSCQVCSTLQDLGVGCSGFYLTQHPVSLLLEPRLARAVN